MSMSYSSFFFHLTLRNIGVTKIRRVFEEVIAKHSAINLFFWWTSSHETPSWSNQYEKVSGVGFGVATSGTAAEEYMLSVYIGDITGSLILRNPKP